MIRLGIGLLVLLGIIGLVLVFMGTWFMMDANAMPDFLQSIGWQSDPIPLPTAIKVVQTPTIEATKPLPTRTITPTIPPLDTQTPTLSPSLSPTPTEGKENRVCPNTYLTQLKVGIRVYASFEPPLPNRIRQDPNTKSTIIGQIRPGEEADVTEGPVCSEGWIWWKIKMSGGVAGWTAEGDGKDYWILPKK